MLQCRRVARRRAGVRSALVGAVRRSDSRRPGDAGARGQSRRAHFAGARRPGARDLRRDARDRYPTVSAGASVDRRDQAIPGFSDEPRGADDLPRRVRRLLGDRSVRPRALADSRRRRDGQSFEATPDDVRVSVVAEIGAQLLRDPRAAAAARRRRAESRQPARDAAAGRGAARRRLRRGTGRRERRGARGGDRGEHPADPNRARAARASARRADRRAARRAGRRPVAAAVSAA